MSLTVSILTPERVVYQSAADFVVFPAVTGEMGILQNHLPVLAQLGLGEVRVENQGKTEVFAVLGGFAEVRNNQISILAETAEMAQEIDAERARQAAERARQVLVAPGPEVDVERVEIELKRALVRLRVVDTLHRRSSPRN
jgi:F-type H+-transporting ATPase subunit epsilon